MVLLTCVLCMFWVISSTDQGSKRTDVYPAVRMSEFSAVNFQTEVQVKCMSTAKAESHCWDLTDYLRLH